MTTTHTTITAEDLWRMPDDGYRHELIRGGLTTTNLADGEHGILTMAIGVALMKHIAAAKLGRVLAAGTGFIIARNPDTVRAPDVAFVAASRVPPSGLPVGYIPFAPDIAVEVLSPSDSQLDVEEKIEQWLAAGTQLVWVVNPRGKTVTVHRAGRDPRILRLADTLEGEEVCPGFSAKLADIFAD